jgi:hypothetical protein
MTKTKIINELMKITRRVIDYQGTIDLGNVRHRFENVFNLPLGEEFVLDVWRQSGLHVMEDVAGTWWASYKT